MRLFWHQIYVVYLQTTFNFHVVSRNSPVTFGFSARHVIDLPSSSVDGTKLNSERLVVLTVSSCEEEEKKIENEAKNEIKYKMQNIYRKFKTIFLVFSQAHCLSARSHMHAEDDCMCRKLFTAKYLKLPVKYKQFRAMTTGAREGEWKKLRRVSDIEHRILWIMNDVLWELS